MRRLAALALALALFPATAHARQPHCTLPLDSCLAEFGRMRHRPWLGLYVEMDSVGNRVVRRVVAGAPAARAGIRPGDILESLDGMPPPQFFAGRAGWKEGQHMSAVVRRGEHDRSLSFTAQTVPEEYFARIVGEHMLEGHLAYMSPAHGGDGQPF